MCMLKYVVWLFVCSFVWLFDSVCVLLCYGFNVFVCVSIVLNSSSVSLQYVFSAWLRPFTLALKDWHHKLMKDFSEAAVCCAWRTRVRTPTGHHSFTDERCRASLNVMVEMEWKTLDISTY